MQQWPWAPCRSTGKLYSHYPHYPTCAFLACPLPTGMWPLLHLQPLLLSSAHRACQQWKILQHLPAPHSLAGAGCLCASSAVPLMCPGGFLSAGTAATEGFPNGAREETATGLCSIHSLPQDLLDPPALPQTTKILQWPGVLG